VIETCIEDQRFPRRIADRPKISDRIAPEEWLGEVPYLARQREAAQEGMRNRQRLTKLAAKHRPLIQYCEKRRWRRSENPLTSALARTRKELAGLP